MEATQTTRRHRPKTPQATFDRVAPYYDRFNAWLSLGFDRRWRRRTARALDLQPGERVVDVATGTGALALELLRSSGGTVHVTGCDINKNMLSVARQRLARAPGRSDLCWCDAAKLPFAAAQFDAATLAFAIDDMPDRELCIAEIARVLRPGGRFALLELSQPDTQPLKGAYELYLDTFRWLKRMQVEGYDHLAEEIRGYRGPKAIEELLQRHGFGEYTRCNLTGGIARLHTARAMAPKS